MEWNEEDFADLFTYELDKCPSELKHISEVYRKYGKHELADEVSDLLGQFVDDVDAA